MVGLLRVHCLIGDYRSALKAVEPIDMEKSGMFTKVPNCYITTLYYTGFGQMMMKRYPRFPGHRWDARGRRLEVKTLGFLNPYNSLLPHTKDRPNPGVCNPSIGCTLGNKLAACAPPDPPT
jgi:hypothetical protein